MFTFDKRPQYHGEKVCAVASLLSVSEPGVQCFTNSVSVVFSSAGSEHPSGHQLSSFGNVPGHAQAATAPVPLEPSEQEIEALTIRNFPTPFHRVPSGYQGFGTQHGGIKQKQLPT